VSRRSVAYHRHCGTRVRFLNGGCPYCETCRKWLMGDAIERVNRRTQKVIREDRRRG
jgi:hypothetical protein